MPVSSTILSLEPAPDTSVTFARGNGEGGGEELEDGVVRLPALGRGGDAYLPRVAMPADDAGNRRAGRDAQPQSGRGRNHDGKDSRAGGLAELRDQAADFARLLADRLALVDRCLVEAVERGAEQRLDPAQLRLEPFLLGRGAAGDRARLGMGFADDRLGLLAGLLAQLLSSALGGDEGRPQEPFELLVADEVELELLDLVGEVGRSRQTSSKLAATSTSRLSTACRL